MAKVSELLKKLEIDYPQIRQAEEAEIASQNLFMLRERWNSLKIILEAAEEQGNVEDGLTKIIQEADKQ